MHAYSSKADYHQRAMAAGVPAIISAGIYPGTSNVMAAHIISMARNEYDKTDEDNWKYRVPPQGERKGVWGSGQLLRIKHCYTPPT